MIDEKLGFRFRFHKHISHWADQASQPTSYLCTSYIFILHPHMWIVLIVSNCYIHRMSYFWAKKSFTSYILIISNPTPHVLYWSCFGPNCVYSLPPFVHCTHPTSFYFLRLNFTTHISIDYFLHHMFTILHTYCFYFLFCLLFVLDFYFNFFKILFRLSPYFLFNNSLSLTLNFCFHNIKI